MALSFDTANLVIESTASIPDLAAFHTSLRDWEDGEVGAIYPVTHSWKALDLGSGAYFYGLDLTNGWTLKFPNAGNYTITGNLGGTIVPVAGVYVERKTSAAFATTAVGGSGPTAVDVADAVWSHSSATTLSDKMLICSRILRNKTVTDPVTGIMTIYNDDDITPYLTAQLHEDTAQTQTYRGQGAEVRGRLT
jgi:hypothetical protein